MGKGYRRRPENYRAVSSHWDTIDWRDEYPAIDMKKEWNGKATFGSLTENTDFSQFVVTK